MGSVGQCSWESFGGAMHRQPSAAWPVCTRAVAASEPDVLVKHLAIERAGDYDLIATRPSRGARRPGAAPGSPSCHVECESRVLLHGSRPASECRNVWKTHF